MVTPDSSSAPEDVPPISTGLDTEASRLPPDNAEQIHADETDDIVPTHTFHTLPVVGLGGSAGCIKPLQEFFTKTAVDTGMVFVVVVHLSPEHDSILAQILQRCTSMPVVQVSENIRVQPDTVYVIPPRKHLSMMNGHITLTNLERERGRRVAVDLFFRTLADTHGPNAMAIVLSGADSDGSIGIKRIKERGGLTVVQDPKEAEYSGMPRSALETGMIDWILKIQEMPERLLSYLRTGSLLSLPSEQGPVLPEPKPENTDDETALRDVLLLLRTRTGRDFTAYKRATILRRIARRMQVNCVENLVAYHTFLRTNPGEAGALLQDLLISVTNFFRDRDAFAALEAAIPHLFAGKGPGDVVRVWTAACATGEEAYSVAILLVEHALTLDSPPQIQVFATDIDENAITAARASSYPEAIAADVSEERLRRFFSKQQGHYRINQSLRELVLFAVHDFLKDAPFSRLDLITCRNVLIYLNREAQSRAFDIFHFALRGDGGLFLGASETAEDAGSLFSVVDKKHRVYRRRGVTRAGIPISNGALSLPLAVKSHNRLMERVVLPVYTPTRHPDQQSQGLTSVPLSKEFSPTDLHFKLIERFAAPSLVVDQDSNIVHLSASAGRYLQLSGGTPTMNLLQLIHPMLRVDLRAALFRAAQTGVAEDIREVPVQLEGKHQVVDLSVRPAADLAPDYFLVVFTERAAPGEPRTTVTTPTSKSEGVVRSLERELELTKQQLRDTMEQHSTSTEEMKATNEELQAMNEELRSASEELETSREELQSINEELTTVNAELKSKVDELGRANSDLQNLMSASNIATVFLDRELLIKRYTPSSVPLFNFIPTDTGRPLSDLAHRLEFPTVVVDAEKVLLDLVPIEREVRGADGRWFLARVTPYRTTENHIGGVVLTFVDITERKAAEDAVRDSEARFRAIVSQNAAGICGSDLEGQIIFANQKLCDLLGWTEAELIGKKFWEVTKGAGTSINQALFEQVKDSHAPFQVEKQLQRKDGSTIWANVSVSVIRDPHGEPHSAVAVIVDTSERRKTEEDLRASRQRLAAIFAQAAVGLSELSLEGRFLRVNDGLCRILGRSRESLLATDAPSITHPDDLPATRDALAKLLKTGEAQSLDKRYIRGDGSLVWANSLFTRLDDDLGHPRAILAVTTDLTGRKEAEHELRRTGEELELRVLARTTELNAANNALRTQIAERIAAELARQEMTRQLVTAQEEERGRISRELHDEVGQHLTALTLGLNALRAGTAENPAELLKTLQSITETLGKEIHDLAIELRPTALDDLGLLRTLTNYFEEWSKRTKIPVDFHHSDWPHERLPAHIETTLYRVICEALNNVLKHARASRVSIIMEQRGGQAVAIVEDDGAGFDSQSAQNSPSRKALGLVGMKERTALVDGELKIESRPGGGTTVFLRVPLPPPPHSHE
jgi:two-component system, chemotaxis family, CheB/CheR fusion protein